VQVLYETGEAAALVAVASMRVGKGRVVYLGFDWHESASAQWKVRLRPEWFHFLSTLFCFFSFRLLSSFSLVR
jgi:hypothetical protein